MDPKEYRKQIERKVDLSKQRQQTKQLKSSHSSAANQRVLESQQPLGHQQNKEKIRSIIGDKSENPSLRAAAISHDSRSSDRTTQLQELIHMLADSDENPKVRFEAMQPFRQHPVSSKHLVTDQPRQAI